MADEESKIKRSLEIAQKTSGESCLSDEIFGVYLDGGATVVAGAKRCAVRGCRSTWRGACLLRSVWLACIGMFRLL